MVGGAGCYEKLVSDGMTMVGITHEMGFAKGWGQILFMDEGKINGRRKP